MLVILMVIFIYFFEFLSMRIDVYQLSGGTMDRPKVLIVDDDLAVCDVIAKHMKMQPWDVFVAHNGVDGLEILRHEKIDLAVVDWRMLIMDGMTLLRECKREKTYTQIVILTGYGTVDSAIEAMKNEAVDYIQKPILAPDFMQKITSLLPSSNSWHGSLMDFLEQKYGDPSFGKEIR